jgi:hypothetical protein
VHKFQAEIKHSPPVTLLHTLTCPNLGAGATCTTGDVRVIRARNVADAVLCLIETYMSDSVKRKVLVCSCCNQDGKSPFEDGKTPFELWSQRRTTTHKNRRAGFLHFFSRH